LPRKTLERRICDRRAPVRLNIIRRIVVRSCSGVAPPERKARSEMISKPGKAKSVHCAHPKVKTVIYPRTSQ
jgi:hypothetical protein